jgi:hypothetical protein
MSQNSIHFINVTSAVVLTVHAAFSKTVPNFLKFPRRVCTSQNEVLSFATRLYISADIAATFGWVSVT